MSQLVKLRKLSANWIWSSVAVVLDAAQQLTTLQELSLVGNGMAVSGSLPWLLVCVWLR